MAIVASLRDINIFSSLPSTPPWRIHPQELSAQLRRYRFPNTHHPVKNRNPSTNQQTDTQPKPQSNPALKLPHHRARYYKPVKEGVKLKEFDFRSELVPCVLLSFDDEQILMWRGQEWKSRFLDNPLIPPNLSDTNIANELDPSDKLDKEQTVSDPNPMISSPKMISLWKQAVESKAVILEELDLGPDDLSQKVEEFEGTSLAAEHTYTALVLSNSDSTAEDYVHDKDHSQEYYSDIDDDFDDECSDDESLDPVGPVGSLSVDQTVRKLREKLR